MANQKNNIDLFGATALVAFSLILGVNHVVIKVVNSGLNPVFFAGIRSFVAFLFLVLYLKLRKKNLVFSKETAYISCLAGIIFALEFLFLFLALDYTTVTRNSIIYYSMPIWLTITAHFLIPEENLDLLKFVGLILAFVGMALSISNNSEPISIYNSAFVGDIFAILAAILWAAIIYMAKATNFKNVTPEMQLIWMVLVSGPLLIFASLFFEDTIREFQFVHLFGLLFQSIVVVSGGFLFWLWLLSIYPASGVASFSFLTPVFTIFFGWLLLGETIGLRFVIASMLVVCGLICINKTPKR